MELWKNIEEEFNALPVPTQQQVNLGLWLAGQSAARQCDSQSLKFLQVSMEQDDHYHPERVTLVAFVCGIALGILITVAYVIHYILPAMPAGLH